MRICQSTPIFAMVLASTLVLSGCSQPAAPSPTVAATVSPAQAKAPTAPPAAATPAPPASPAAVAAASPTVAALASPTAVVPPVAKPTVAGPTTADLAAKARTATEYAFDLRMTSPGQTATGKVYVKGTKMRNETSIGGQSMVMIVDTATKVAYMLMPGQNAAVKADFSQVAAQAPNPTEQVSGLPANARFVGNETIDGKPAAAYEATTPQGTTRYSIWTERGLPLRVETATAPGKVTIEFSNYQFGQQPDSLFQLPPGTQVIDVPSGIPGVPGGLPKPTP